MRTLIYKRTHEGDPHPKKGLFGNNDCMGKVRGWPFDAVIGIGGIGREAERNGIARKLTWVGVGANKKGEPGRQLVTFDRFRYYGEQGRLLEEIAPVLARHMYGKNVRVLINLSSEERREVKKILRLAEDAPPSNQLAEGDFQDTSGKCRSKSCGG